MEEKLEEFLDDVFNKLDYERRIKSYAKAIAAYCGHSLCRNCVFDDAKGCTLIDLPSNWRVGKD